MTLTQEIKNKMTDESVSIQSLTKKLNYKYRADQISNTCSYLVSEGLLVRTGRGIYAKAEFVKDMDFKVKRETAALILTPKNKEFLNKFYMINGKQTVDGFLNQIIEEYKENLFKGVM